MGAAQAVMMMSLAVGALFALVVGASRWGRERTAVANLGRFVGSIIFGGTTAGVMLVAFLVSLALGIEQGSPRFDDYWSLVVGIGFWISLAIVEVGARAWGVGPEAPPTRRGGRARRRVARR